MSLTLNHLQQSVPWAESSEDHTRGIPHIAGFYYLMLLIHVFHRVPECRYVTLHSFNVLSLGSLMPSYFANVKYDSNQSEVQSLTCRPK